MVAINGLTLLYETEYGYFACNADPSRTYFLESDFMEASLISIYKVFCHFFFL